MQDLITVITNNGVAVAVLVYFIYRDNKFMTTLQTTLQTLIDTVDALKDSVNNNPLLRKED